jgi:two-component system sensor kinase FixL
MSDAPEIFPNWQHAIFRAFIEDSDRAICLTTLNGRPFYMNHTGRRLTGLDEEEVLPAPTLHECYAEGSWIELRDVAVPQVTRIGRWEGRSRLRNRRTGALVELETAVFLIRDPVTQVPMFLALVHQDAPPGQRLEQALAESESRKSAILESALDPIITVNAAGVITEFNRAAEQVFGHPRSRVLGTRPSEVLFPAGHMESYQTRIDRYLETGEGSMLGKRGEVTAVRAGGEAFPAEMAMTLSRQQGEPVMTFFLRDISQQKKAEEEQARYAAELERSNRELEQFAYVASHDLQEPLRKILTFGDRLADSCGASLDDTGRECLGRMRDAAERMRALIDGLLTLSRVTTKGQQFVPVDLGRIAREVLRDLEVPIEQAGARLELENLPTVQADPLQMRQLLQNLLGNALKFRRDGQRPVIRVRGRYLRGRGQRAVGESLEEERCQLEIEDNGIGFDEKYRERIFGLFQRLHPRNVYPGTGVGLAICRKIVERHGGTLTAHSEPGRGATFVAVFPVVPPKVVKTDGG